MNLVRDVDGDDAVDVFQARNRARGHACLDGAVDPGFSLNAAAGLEHGGFHRFGDRVKTRFLTGNALNTTTCGDLCDLSGSCFRIA